MDRCVFLGYFYSEMWVGVTVQSIFMSACTFLEYIYGWVCVFITMGGIDCLQHIYGWVCLFRTQLSAGVTV